METIDLALGDSVLNMTAHHNLPGGAADGAAGSSAGPQLDCSHVP